MANPYVNRVVVNGSDVINLTSDTVTASNLIVGVTAHNKAGAPINGTAGAITSSSNDQLYSNSTILLGCIDN